MQFKNKTILKGSIASRFEKVTSTPKEILKMLDCDNDSIKANYLYQLRYRISALLAQKGPERFREIQRRIFMLAA